MVTGSFGVGWLCGRWDTYTFAEIPILVKELVFLDNFGGDGYCSGYPSKRIARKPSMKKNVKVTAAIRIRTILLNTGVRA